MPVIQHAEARRTETPGGVMTTLASPTQGGATLSMWRVEVPAGVSGPVHFIDAEQIWTVLSGHLTVELDGTKLSAAQGDTVILPADLPRQVRAAAEGFTAIVTATPQARASTPGAPTKVVPPWIA